MLSTNEMREKFTAKPTDITLICGSGAKSRENGRPPHRHWHSLRETKSLLLAR